jgi:hypothetical protein
MEKPTDVRLVSKITVENHFSYAVVGLVAVILKS